MKYATAGGDKQKIKKELSSVIGECLTMEFLHGFLEAYPKKKKERKEKGKVEKIPVVSLI